MMEKQKMLTAYHLAGILCLSCISALGANVTKITQDEAKTWIRHLIPLPHEISIQGKRTLNPRDIRIRLRQRASETEKQAAAELEQLFRDRAGVVPTGSRFEILIGVLDAQQKIEGIAVVGAERLKTLPNHEQAYMIQPQKDHKLLLVGFNEQGVYYAARTLYQLLEPALSQTSVCIPLAEVVDWPDMQERGIWNFPQPAEWIPWMASLKLNYGEMFTPLQEIERGKKNHALIDEKLFKIARLKALNYMPNITHLNFLQEYGLYRAYPELAGKGDGALAGRYFAHKYGDQHRVPYAAHPILKQILEEWMADIASKGVDEIGCWLSERPAEDGHTETAEVGQAVLEARAFIGAWREVRKQYPHFRIRLFLSNTTSGKYYKVIAEAPPDVKVERACATELERVLHVPRDLLRNPLLDSHAAQGRWIASYDVPITANARVETPEFMVPESSAYRVKEYVGQLVERNYRGAYAMMGWNEKGKETCGFNINALAEWTWNMRGRSEKEFAIAWATREGFEHPEEVGNWAELMGPVEFDVYDSDFPVAYSWGKFVEMIMARRRPYLGEGIFRYYASPQDFDEKLERCDKALRIAAKFERKDLANETRVVVSYIKLAKWLYYVADQVATDDLSTLGGQATLREFLKHLDDAGKENVTAIKEWRSALGPEPWHYRVHDAMKATENTVRDVTQFVSGRYLY
jgi:hypothetical protein